MSSYPNPMTLIDFYKSDHRRHYPKNTTRVQANWTPRSSRIQGHKKVIFFGGQYFLQKYMMDDFRTGFFDLSVDYVAERYARRMNNSLGPNTIGTDHIRELHKLQYLPLQFNMIPEGTAVPLRVPMLTVENTHNDFGWLTNYFETIMSNVLWLPCTSATTAMNFRGVLEQAAINTGSPPEFVDWQGHDFSFRGLPGLEAAQLSGAAHLLFFNGTDTIPAIDFVEDWYGVPEGYFIGGSVAATEHSVMCAGGEDGELETFNRLLDLYPSGILSVVSDTWDLWNVITTILPQLKDRIMVRDGKLVIRPDSGDPANILCGDPSAAGPANKGVVELLWDIFGGTKTAKGHRLLDSHIGSIYGDSITIERAQHIAERLAAKGFASANVVFGIGSFTYQYVTRDTYGFAMKATWVEIDGKGRSIYKTPKTDNGVKNSARGRLAVLRDTAGQLHLVEEATPAQEAASCLLPTWRDGQFQRRETYDLIRARARLNLAA
jgi:nicotinamide phosphoribosyltransferase